MNQTPPDWLHKVPTLTEVVSDLAAPLLTGDLQNNVSPSRAGRDQVDRLLDLLHPQIEALIATHLQEVLAPALQEAIAQVSDEVLQRMREPLVEAVTARLRDGLEAAWGHRLPQSDPAHESGSGSDHAPGVVPTSRIP